MTNELKDALTFKAYFEPNGTLVQRDLDTIKTWQRTPEYQEALKNCRFRVKSFLGRPSHLVLEEKSTFSKFVGGLKNFFGIDSEKRAMEKRLVNTALSSFNVQGNPPPNIGRLSGMSTSCRRAVYSYPVSYVSPYPGQRVFIQPAPQWGYPYAYGHGAYMQPAHHYPQPPSTQIANHYRQPLPQQPQTLQAPQLGHGNSEEAKLDKFLQGLESECMKMLTNAEGKQSASGSKAPEDQMVHSRERSKSASTLNESGSNLAGQTELKKRPTSVIENSQQSPTGKTVAKKDSAENESADEKLKAVSAYVLNGIAKIQETLKKNPEQMAQKSKEFMTQFFGKFENNNPRLLASYLKSEESKEVGIYFSRLLMNTQKGKEWCNTEKDTSFGQLLNRGLTENAKEVEQHQNAINEQIRAQQQFINQLGQLTKNIKVGG